MKYYRWKLKWENGEGIDFTRFVNNETTRVEPDFATGDLQDSATWIYGYLLSGSITVADLSDWFVEEVTSAEILSAAQELNANVVMGTDGRVEFPPIEE
jgi:hypothetical protein